MQNQAMGGQRMPNISQMQHIFLEGMRPELAYLNYSQRQPPPQAQLQRTFTIRNDVNLKKNSLKLIQDDAHPDRYHLEFTFDAATECSITVHFAALEVPGEAHARFSPLKEDSSHPKEYRPKGLGQTFRTRPENALDVSAYGPGELKYEPSAARFPVIICLEAGGPEAPTGPKTAVQSQSTFAYITGLEGDTACGIKPLKQKIQVGTTAYELQEIYGIEGQAAGAGGAEAAASQDDDGEEKSRECVICMTEPRDTTVLPCRHMCMCSECAKVLRLQSNKCPICRTSIESLLQIKISKQDDAAATPATPATPAATPAASSSGPGTSTAAAAAGDAAA